MRHPRFCGRPRAIAGLAACLLVLAVPTSLQAHRAPNDWAPSHRACGAFTSSYHTHVYAKQVTCALARRIQIEYWNGPLSRKVIVDGGSGANGYVRLKRFPGWICRSGAGAGACTKGSRSAAYTNYVL